MGVFRAILDHWQIRRSPVAWARAQGVRIGADCRLIELRRGTFGSEPYLVSLGDHVTVTGMVQFITHDGGVWVFRQQHPDIDVLSPIKVGNNVFIGYGAILMPGVTIGNDCVIGAGSVVTRDIPPGVVAVGTPAKPIKTVAEYWASIQGRATHELRSLPPAEKRKVLT